MEEQLCYDSASKIGSKLNEFGIPIGYSISSRSRGYSFKLTRSTGSNLPGAIRSQQLRWDIKPVEGYGTGKTYLIVYGNGKNGHHVSSERRRCVSGRKELLGHVRGGDFIYLVELSVFLARERNNRLLNR